MQLIIIKDCMQLIIKLHWSFTTSVQFCTRWTLILRLMCLSSTLAPFTSPPQPHSWEDSLSSGIRQLPRGPSQLLPWISSPVWLAAHWVGAFLKGLPAPKYRVLMNTCLDSEDHFEAREALIWCWLFLSVPRALCLTVSSTQGRAF